MSFNLITIQPNKYNDNMKGKKRNYYLNSKYKGRRMEHHTRLLFSKAYPTTYY